jgi:hypothetical protein
LLSIRFFVNLKNNTCYPGSFYLLFFLLNLPFLKNYFLIKSNKLLKYKYNIPAL